MSYLPVSRPTRRSTIKFILCIALAFLFSLALAGLSFADPIKQTQQHKKDDPANIAKQVQGEDTVMTTNTALPPKSEESSTSSIDAEGTEDLAETTQELTQETTKPTVDMVPESLPANTTAESKVQHIQTQYACYPQDDDSIECVCETEETCAALKQSNICQDTSYWGMEEGFGGCTKIQMKKDDE